MSGIGGLKALILGLAEPPGCGPVLENMCSTQTWDVPFSEGWVLGAGKATQVWGLSWELSTNLSCLHCSPGSGTLLDQVQLKSAGDVDQATYGEMRLSCLLQTLRPGGQLLCRVLG